MKITFLPLWLSVPRQLIQFLLWEKQRVNPDSEISWKYMTLNPQDCKANQKQRISTARRKQRRHYELVGRWCVDKALLWSSQTPIHSPEPMLKARQEPDCGAGAEEKERQQILAAHWPDRLVYFGSSGKCEALSQKNKVTWVLRKNTQVILCSSPHECMHPSRKMCT